MSAEPARLKETPETHHETTRTYEEVYYGKTLCKITTITKKDPERIKRANDYVVQCLLNRLPELLAKYK